MNKFFLVAVLLMYFSFANATEYGTYHFKCDNLEKKMGKSYVEYGRAEFDVEIMENVNWEGRFLLTINNYGSLYRTVLGPAYIHSRLGDSPGFNSQFWKWTDTVAEYVDVYPRKLPSWFAYHVSIVPLDKMARVQRIDREGRVSANCKGTLVTNKASNPYVDFYKQFKFNLGLSVEAAASANNPIILLDRHLVDFSIPRTEQILSDAKFSCFAIEAPEDLQPYFDQLYSRKIGPGEMMQILTSYQEEYYGYSPNYPFNISSKILEILQQKSLRIYAIDKNRTKEEIQLYQNMFSNNQNEDLRRWDSQRAVAMGKKIAELYKGDCTRPIVSMGLQFGLNYYDLPSAIDELRNEGVSVDVVRLSGEGFSHEEEVALKTGLFSIIVLPDGTVLTK